MLPNNSHMDENKAWQWHGIMSAYNQTYVPFPQIAPPIKEEVDLYDRDGNTNYLHQPKVNAPEMYDGNGNLNYLYNEGC